MERSIMRADLQARSQSLRRALAILRCFVSEGEIGVSDIARRCGLSSSTTFRLCRALIDEGYLVQHESSKRYALGPEAIALGHVGARRLGTDRARAALTMMEAPDLPPVKLGIDCGSYAAVILRARIGSPYQPRIETGSTRFPLHASALGKALLAFRPDWKRHASEFSTMPGLGPQLDGDRSALLEQLAVARNHGYATSVAEWRDGLACVAAPVLDDRGEIRGALAVSLPKTCRSETTVGAYGTLVRAIAVKVGHAMRDVA